jgi:outer membrane protein assembly factor BamB
LPLALCLALPFAQQTIPPPGLPVPQRPTGPTTPAPAAAPAPVPNPYDQAWIQTLDIDHPGDVAVNAHAIYVTGTTPHRDAEATPHHVLLARDLTDGHELWRLDFVTLSAVAVDDDRVVISADGALRSVNPTTAAVQWTTPDVGNADCVVSRGGWIIAASGSDLGAFRAKDGSVVWRQTLGPSIDGPPAIDGNALFVTLADGRLLRLSILTGATEWTTWFEADAKALLAANDLVYVSLGDGRFVAYAQADGRYRWSYLFGAGAIGAPVSDTDHVYVALSNNTVQALDRHIGNQRWKVALTDRPMSGPMLGTDGVLMPTTNGEISIAKRKDGHTTGRIPPPPTPEGAVEAVRLLAVATGPGDVVVRLVAESATTFTLAAFHRKAPDAKK